MILEKGVDKEHYTVGARLIRLEDKVQYRLLIWISQQNVAFYNR